MVPNGDTACTPSARAVTFVAAADAAHETGAAHAEQASGRRTFISPRVLGGVVDVPAAAADAANDSWGALDHPLNGRRYRMFDAVSFQIRRLTSRCC
jgi:hypothetical protein